MRWTSVLLTRLKDFSNFPKSYIERSMEQVYWRTPTGKPQYLPRTIQKKKFRYTTNQPWTMQFRNQNQLGKNRKKVFIPPIAEWSYFRGDRVEILVGKDKGKQGIITQVIPQRNWVLVQGLNWHYRRIDTDKTTNSPGVMIQSEAPLLVDQQVSLVDPSDLKPTTIEWRYTEEGERVRVSLKTGRIIPIPNANEETYDYKTKSAYIEREKDTPATVVTEVTFEPALKTFEMDIMDEMKIEESSTPRKTYWY